MNELGFKEILKDIYDKKLYIILAALIFGLIGNIYARYIVEPKYEASTTLILATIQETDKVKKETTAITQSDLNVNQMLISTYREIIESDAVLNEVIENLNLDLTPNELRRYIKVSAVKDSGLIEIRMRAPYKTMIAPVVKEIANVFSKRITEIYKINNIYVIDEPLTPTQPYNKNTLVYIAGFASFAIAVSLAIILVSKFFDTTIKNEEDIEELRTVLLAKIPMHRRKEGEGECVLYENPKAGASEAIRTLRTNVKYAGKKDTKTFLFTSCDSGDGKSWTAANFAVSMAKAGERVVLIDADLRKGRQSDIFMVKQSPGLSDYLQNPEQVKPRKCLRKTFNDRLLLMPQGEYISNPSELLNTENLTRLIKYFYNKVDVIIFDSTPCSIVADALVISKMVDSTILVAMQNHTKMSELKKVQNNIKRIGGNLTGIVLNKVKARAKQYNYYYRREKNQDDEQIKLLCDGISKTTKSNEILKQMKKYLDDNI